MSNRKLIAFPYLGGKFLKLDFILPYLPNDAKHYVEVFGGSAAVLLNREPAQIETYNDLYSDVYIFFKVLRSDGDELISLLDHTPYSRQEFENACAIDDTDTDIEIARKFFIRSRQSFIAMAQSNNDGIWGYTVTDNTKVCPVTWNNSIRVLEKIIDRLRSVQIENRPAIDVINRYDSPDTLFYVDPPYVSAIRGGRKIYKHEMTDDDHIELADELRAIKGRAVVSGWRSDLYDDIYSDWVRMDGELKGLNSSNRGAKKQESLWINFDPPAGLGAKQLDVFA